MTVEELIRALQREDREIDEDDETADMVVLSS